jgi:transposase
MNVATDEVLDDTRTSHESTDVLQFFELIDLHVAGDLDIHSSLDNLSAHNAPPVVKWLADPKRARWHLHFTPTSSSWLNLVERWFAELTNRKLRRSAHRTVTELETDIRKWISEWNKNPRPFVWTKTADEILETLAAYCGLITDSGH